MLNNITDKILNVLCIIISIAIVVCLCVVIVKSCKNEEEYNTPVEETVIDSLEVDNIKLKEEIKQLDTIKNEKVAEVESLDNDGTLILFRKLTSK